MTEKILRDIDSLEGQTIEQFIQISDVLKNEHGNLFDAKLNSTTPPDIKMRINFGDKLSLLDECILKLVRHGASYMLDKHKTLYVHIDCPNTLQLMTRSLHKFILNNFESRETENQIHLAS